MLDTASVILAAMLANTNESTTALTSAPPVQIKACSIASEVSYYPEGGGDAEVFLPSAGGQTLNIRFANDTNKQISRVTFALTNGAKQMVDVSDAGKFSPGVSIAHSFNSPVSSAHGFGCTVSSVAFSDGSTWMGKAPLVALAMK